MKTIPPMPSPAFAGTARRARVVLLAAAALLAAACGRGGPPAGGPGGFPPAPVTLLEVSARTVPLRLEYVAQTAGSKEAEVRARVQGILEKRAYREGARVSAGQTLFVIDPKPYAAQVEQAAAALAQAQAQHAQARRDLQRLKPLVADAAISRREYDDAVSAEETSAAAVKQAQARLTEAKLNLSYTTVTAPVSGFASRALKSEGSLVSPGADSLLTTISQLDPMYVNFSISEGERLRFDRQLAAGKLVAPELARGGQPVALRLEDGSVFPRQGKLAFIDPRIDPASGAFNARATVPNPDGALHPGQFVRVVVDAGERPDAIVVPQRAVMDGPQGKFVYVAGKSAEGKDVALTRPVDVGDWVDLDGERMWIIESGLKAGEPLVVDGMAKIFPVPGGAPIMLGPPPGTPGGPGATAPGKADGKGAAEPKK